MLAATARASPLASARLRCNEQEAGLSDPPAEALAFSSALFGVIRAASDIGGHEAAAAVVMDAARFVRERVAFPMMRAKPSPAERRPAATAVRLHRRDGRVSEPKPPTA